MPNEISYSNDADVSGGMLSRFIVEGSHRVQITPTWKLKKKIHDKCIEHADDERSTQILVFFRISKTYSRRQ